MKENVKQNKKMDEMTVLEALARDVGELFFRSSVIVDPAPVPFIPVTPIVVGKKMIRGAGKLFNAVKEML